MAGGRGGGAGLPDLETVSATYMREVESVVTKGFRAILSAPWCATALLQSAAAAVACAHALQ